MSVTKETADSYMVEKDGEHAVIFVRHGETYSKRHWASLSIISSYGNYGYHWSHMGMPYNEFFAELDYHYAMNKMTGGKHMVFDLDGTIGNIKKRVIEWRKEVSIDKQESRKIWDAMHIIEGENPRSTTEFYYWLSDNDIYFDDDLTRDKECPNTMAFWNKLWPEFISGINKNTAQAAETREE